MSARLTIETGEGAPRVYELCPERPTTLGRSRDNTITLKDEHASRQHAKIYFEAGQWFILDCGTLNGTRLGAERIHGPAPLGDGQLILIGAIRLRFTLAAQAADQPCVASDPPDPVPDAAEAVPTPTSSDLRTALRADELSAMYALMSDSVRETDTRTLIRRALATVAAQTGAAITGFLSLDKDDPLPKLVLPETARVNIHLSRKLTDKVQKESRPVWLGASTGTLEQNDSLAPFHDALCLPLLADGTALGALHAYKCGQFFSERDLRFCEVVAGFVANSLIRIQARLVLEAENSRLRSHAPVSEKLIGDSEPLRQLRQFIARAAPRPSTVLIQGESGSGKELVAQDLHRQSSRRHGPLVVLNCAAIAPNLLEAELFGHIKGSFTGATCDRAGLFQQADGGSLFLDEIGELSLDFQSKLLRAIEGKGFRPVGSLAEILADVRIIAATHRDLEGLVKEGKFRQDLYFRLCVIRLRVPPLRDHAEDIPQLVDYFLGKLAVECGRRVRLTEAAVDRLMGYAWPGNVRQLRAVLENAVVMSESDTIDAGDLLLPAPGPAPADQPPSLNLEEVEAWTIRLALQKTNYNNSQAARLLGIVRETLAAKRKKYKIGKDGEG
jgi:transcriptional regulator with GAF, ATPase, and Fis domain